MLGEPFRPSYNPRVNATVPRLFVDGARIIGSVMPRVFERIRQERKQMARNLAGASGQAA